MAKRNLTRAEIAELYQDVKAAMGKMKNPKEKTAKSDTSIKETARQIAESVRLAMSKDAAPRASASSESPRAGGDLLRERDMSALVSGRKAFQSAGSGQRLAIGVVVLFALLKVSLSAMEAAGFASVQPAQASMAAGPNMPKMAREVVTDGLSREEVALLTQLDKRRVELEERGRKMDARGKDLDARESELSVKFSQLKDLTERLKGEREKDGKHRSAQLDQLANVYSSMNPNEAAKLMEQLDNQIALTLLSRMPEKRIGQILALMSSDRALTITKLLSGKQG